MPMASPYGFDYALSTFAQNDKNDVIRFLSKYIIPHSWLFEVFFVITEDIEYIVILTPTRFDFNPQF